MQFSLTINHENLKSRKVSTFKPGVDTVGVPRTYVDLQREVKGGDGLDIKEGEAGEG